ncbi:MAG: MRG-domain-containing protein [Piptocephalis tieghemiana]|nr:MAG: MRG-domain-containing protein [Piptocephalis tieghemiana]
MTDSASTYTVGEEALCYHQHALYLAKILRIKQLRPNEEELRYFVHYPGWNKKWDEWVSPERLFKNTEANRRKHQHRIPDYDKIAGIKRSSTPMEDTEMSGSSDKARKIGGKKKTKPGGSKGTSEDKPKAGEKRRKESPSGGSRSDQSSPAAPGRNRGDLPLVPSTTGQSMQPNQPLTFTRGLKALMVDDFERVTRLQQLVTLPRTPNVANILHLYGQEDGDAEKKDLEVYAPALVAIFDLMLPNALLYRLERAQWASHLTDSPDARPSQVYGYEHLLRLLGEYSLGLLY